MNPFNVMTLAAFCGALAQPVVMAQEFTLQPAPVVGRPFDKESASPEAISKFSHELLAGKDAVLRLTDQVDKYYVILVDSSTENARKYIEDNGTETIEACEMFLRAFEVAVKKTIEQDNLPAFVTTEMRSYWRIVAKARSTVTRLNKFTKSLTEDPVVFEGSTNLEHLRTLASLTTEKLGSMSFH